MCVGRKEWYYRKTTPLVTRDVVDDSLRHVSVSSLLIRARVSIFRAMFTQIPRLYAVCTEQHRPGCVERSVGAEEAGVMAAEDQLGFGWNARFGGCLHKVRSSISPWHPPREREGVHQFHSVSTLTGA